MPIKVEIQGRGIVAEFPDGTDQRVIDAAIKRDYFSASKRTVGDRLVGTAKNVPGSAYKVGSDIYQAVRHPIDTAKGLGNLALGGVEEGIRQLAMLDPNHQNLPRTPQEQMFMQVIDPIIKSFQDPASVPGRVADYTELNPIGMLLNLSLGAGMTGKAAGTGNAARTLSKTSEAINPITWAGKPVRAGLERLAYRSKVTPEMERRIKLARESGVPLTVADITGKKSHALLESQLSKNTGSADIAQDFTQRKMTATQKYAMNVQGEAFGGPSDALSSGQIAQKASDKRYKAFQAKASRLYDAVPVKPETPISTKALRETALGHMDELGKIENPTVKRILKAVQEVDVEEAGLLVSESGSPLSVTRTPAYTWQQLRGDQSALRKMAQTTGDYNKKRILNDLVNAINDDIGSFAKEVQDPGIKKALDAANKYYKDGDARLPGVRVFRDRQIANMMKTSSPEDIVGQFMKARPNASDIQRLKEVAGPRGFKAIKQAWLEDILTKGEAQSLSPAKFVTTYDKYRQGGNLGVILEAGEREGLDKLYDISRLINSAEKRAGNPSGTAQNVINSAAHWIAHPVVMSLTHIATKKLANLYFYNPAFQKLLVQGLRSSPMSKNATLIARNITQIATKPSVVNPLYVAGENQ